MPANTTSESPNLSQAPTGEHASSDSLTESTVDVLVIGAGPSGLMAATALKRAGISVRIIDKSPQPTTAGQADGIQPRTLEILQNYGLADELLRRSCHLHLAAFYNPSSDGDGIEFTGRVPVISVANARYPFSVTLYQGGIEGIFHRALHAMGVEVERPVYPTSISVSEDEGVLRDPEAHAVKVHLAHDALASSGDARPAEVVHARFVLGTDGARSWVRKALGLVLEGEQTDYYWGVIDFVPETDFPDARANCAILTHQGSMKVIPREGDMMRLYVQLDATDIELDEAGDFDRSKMSPDRLLQIAKQRFHPYHIDLKDPAVGYDWWTIYRIGQRVANKYGVHERVFLAGDATHTHSPKAGQGMNAGINDAHNLAWKLAQVMHGHATMDLLKTYELERRQYALDLIAFDKKYAKLFSGKPPSKDELNGVTHDEFFAANRSFGAFVSGIGVTYAPSIITKTAYQEYASKIVVGERLAPHVFIRAASAEPVEIQDLLPANALFKILVFTGDRTRSGFADDVKQIAERLTATLAKYGGIAASESMDVVTILGGKLDPASVQPLPAVLRPHWSRVLVDDVDTHGRHPGGGYKEYGIDISRGAVVVVRPDSFVGAIVPLQRGEALLEYFDGFLRPCSGWRP